MASSYGRFMFNVLRNCRTAFQSGRSISRSAMHKSASHSTSLPTLDMVSLFNFSHSGKCIVFIFISLMGDNLKIFPCLWAIHVSFFVKYLLHIFLLYCLLITEFEFFMCFGCKFFVLFMCCKYFLLICDLHFCFSGEFQKKRKFFYLDEVQLIIFLL